MTALSSYSTGTVTVAANGTTVTGAGAIWSGVNVRPGDILQIGNFQTVITDVTDTSHLVIPPWGGGAQAGANYVIWQWYPQRVAGALVAQSVNEMVGALATDGFFVFVSPDLTEPDPSYGEDGQFALQPSTGKMWVKTAGAWSFVGIYKGFGTPAPYDNAHTYSVMDVATSSGSSYVYINATPSAGHVPPNATYWAVLASKGDTGATGATGAAGTNAPKYGGTTLTSMTVGTGSKTFTTQAGLAYQPGARIRIWASGGQWMEGIIQTYSGTSMNVTVDKTFGSGTIASWNINIAGEPGSGDILSTNNGSDFASIAQVRRNLALPIVARGYISGLTLSTPGGSVSFSVAPGVCVDSNLSPSFASGGDFIFLSGSMSKAANAAWSSGGGGGSLDAGSLTASTWYHVYVIKNPSTNATDVMISLSATAPTLPSGYTIFRRIGSLWITSLGVISKFLQVGDEFFWDVPVADASAFSLTNSHTLITLTVPPLVSVAALLQANFTNTSAPAIALLYPVVITNQVPGTPTGNFNISNQVTNQFGASGLDIRTNTSAQIGARASSASSNSLYIITKGWRDGRGRFD